MIATTGFSDRKSEVSGSFEMEGRRSGKTAVLSDRRWVESQAMPAGDWWRSKRRLAVRQLLPFPGEDPSGSFIRFADPRSGRHDCLFPTQSRHSPGCLRASALPRKRTSSGNIQTKSAQNSSFATATSSFVALRQTLARLRLRPTSPESQAHRLHFGYRPR